MVTFLCSTPLMCRNGEFRALTRIDKVFTHGSLHEHEKGHMIPREAGKVQAAMKNTLGKIQGIFCRKAFRTADTVQQPAHDMSGKCGRKRAGSYEKKILLSRWYIRREKRRFICKKTSDIPERKGSGPV